MKSKNAELVIDRSSGSDVHEVWECRECGTRWGKKGFYVQGFNFVGSDVEERHHFSCSIHSRKKANESLPPH